MGTRPVLTLAGAGLAAAGLVWAISGARFTAQIFLGLLGPLIGALATWLIVERTHARTPAATGGMMIRLFAAKMVGFGAYIAAVVLLLADGIEVFVVSFTGHYILLHLIEAVYLRRLFAGATIE